jgi:putative addiction module component (TIGR02574 family)
MKKTPLTEVLELSVSERILLVEDIWDSIAAFPESVPLTDIQKQELERRLEAYHKNPVLGSPWEEVVARIKAKG